MAQPILLLNGAVIAPTQIIADGAVLIEGGRIAAVGPRGRVHAPECARVLDLHGAYIGPGFIDLHIHGAWGGDVMAASEHELARIGEGLVKGGVTSYLPTTLSGPLDGITRAVACVERAMKRKSRGARILGVHLEGPYFCQEQRGAQNPAYIIDPRPEDYLSILDRYPCIIRVSAAPELPGALELGEELRRRGIVASIAHSNATYQEVLRAVESGYSHVTHVFSGMSTVRRINAYRVSGVVESTLLLDELTTEIIADGHHLPPSLIRLVLKAKGPAGVCLVTDSMSAAGMGPGTYSLGGLQVRVEAEVPETFEIPARDGNYVAKLLDGSAFASSVATMDQMVRNMVKLAGLTVADAVRLATANPARMQGIGHEVGSVAAGLRADLTIFDRDINILMTLVAGEVAYQSA